MIFQGNRQKIGIIGAMIINPKVLLLDEPFNYLDPSSQMTIAHMIQRICKEQGTTVIISSHNLNFVADISSRILLLEKGKLVKPIFRMPMVLPSLNSTVLRYSGGIANIIYT